MASETITEAEQPPQPTLDMELENPNLKPVEGENGSKREREGDDADKESEENVSVSKKQKLEEQEKSVEEERMEKLEQNVGPVHLGPKSFGSSVEMFDYFYKFLHHWPMNVRVNQYEYLVLLELINKGHPEPEKKIGPGIDAFEIRYHPTWQSRCFFVIRADKSTEDFSFRKCVDHILPLPENMKIKTDVNKALGGNGRGKKGRGGGGRGGHGRGRGRGGNRR